MCAEQALGTTSAIQRVTMITVCHMHRLEATLTQNQCFLFLGNHLTHKHRKETEQVFARGEPRTHVAGAHGSKTQGTCKVHALDCVCPGVMTWPPPFAALPELTASCLHMGCQLGQATQFPGHFQSGLAMSEAAGASAKKVGICAPYPERVSTHTAIAAGSAR